MKTSKFADARFWVDAFDRAVASFAQGAIGALGLDSAGVLDVDWGQGLSIAGAMGLLSVLTSVAFRGGANRDNNVDGPGV